MITIYGMSGCKVCEKAITLAEEYNLRYTYKDATIPDNHREFSKLFPNERRVPQIMWFERHVGGYEEFLEEISNTRNYGDGPI